MFRVIVDCFRIEGVAEKKILVLLFQSTPYTKKYLRRPKLVFEDKEFCINFKISLYPTSWISFEVTSVN